MRSKLKKVLLTGIAALVFYGCSHLSVASKGVTVPDNYKQAKYVIGYGLINFEGIPMYGIILDFNGDKIADFQELYLVMGMNPKTGKPILSPNALFYSKNDNQNSVFEKDEFYIDRLVDGWNGNETRFVDMEKKKPTFNKYMDNNSCRI